MSATATQPTGMLCNYCFHPYHHEGQNCGVPNPVKPCKCKAKPKWWEGLGNAIGESLFGGNR